jgi:predicted glycoside hydrolase/deacetylase ChbG (UPF0249 family)
VKMIIRADDVGFTDVCNIGAFETIEHGLTTSADVMLDCPGTVDALRRLKDLPWISVGWHTHMWGSPVLDARQVPSLVEHGGQFDGRFRTDLQLAEDVAYEEASAELRAQLDLCLRILGRVPDTAGSFGNRPSSPWQRASLAICEEYGLPHNFARREAMSQHLLARIRRAQDEGLSWARDLPLVGGPVTLPDPKWAERNIVVAEMHQAYIDLYTDSFTQVEEHYDPVLYYTEDRAHLLDYPDDTIVEQSWHPGYVDYFVYRLGERSHRERARPFVLARVQDTVALCSDRLKAWVLEHRIELINFRDALYGTCDYQNHLKITGSSLYIRG